MRSILLAFVLLVACGDDSEPEVVEAKPSMTGTWKGSAGGVTFNYTLSQKGTDITGSGQGSDCDVSIAETVKGTNVYPNVSLTMSAAGYTDSNFSGRFADTNTLPGKLNGSGFVDSPLTLTRQ